MAKDKTLLGESPRKQGKANTGHSFRMMDLFYFAFIYFSLQKNCGMMFLHYLFSPLVTKGIFSSPFG